MRIECDGNSLVGRFEAKRGVARKIEVEPPLHLVEGNKLMLAPAEGVQGQLDSLQAQINDLKSLVNGASNSLQNQIYAMTGGAEGVSLQSLLELVNSLQDQIDHIVSGSTQTLATLNTKINSEITNRGNADAAIAVPVNRLIDGVIYWCATQASYTTGEAGPLLLVNLGAPWPPAKL